jgi:hypothetical protein
VKSIAAATEEEIVATGMPKNVAKAIVEHFNEK